jgi:hypothetical protein
VWNVTAGFCLLLLCLLFTLSLLLLLLFLLQSTLPTLWRCATVAVHC